MEILDAPEAPWATLFAFEMKDWVWDWAIEERADALLASSSFELPAAGFAPLEAPAEPPTEP